MTDDNSSDRRLQDMQRHISDLPVLPTLVGRLVTLDMTSEGAFDEVVEIAEEEPTFTVRILALANSALFAPNQEILNIRQAVSRVGACRIAELCTSMALLRAFSPTSDEERGLWKHALQTAVAARHIASASPVCSAEPQDAYLLGLLHDFGRFVLVELAPDELRPVDEVGLNLPELLVILEKKALGFDHSEVGALAMEHWGLPASIVAYIRAYHRYDEVESLAQHVVDPQLLQVVQIADHLSVQMLLAPSDFAEGSLVAAADMSRCLFTVSAAPPIDAESLASLVPAIRAESDALFLGLGI
jgi:HD-like signal output (HDOD) protein